MPVTSNHGRVPNQLSSAQPKPSIVTVAMTNDYTPAYTRPVLRVTFSSSRSGIKAGVRTQNTGLRIKEKRAAALSPSGFWLLTPGFCFSSDRFKECIVNVAVAPFFARLKGFDDRMLCLMKVLSGVLVLRAIAAAHVPADFTETKMNPSIASLQTVFAPACARRDIARLR